MSDLRVWVQYTGAIHRYTGAREPTKVTIASESDIDDLKEAAIEKLKLPHAPSDYLIKMSKDGEALVVNAKVKDLPCGDDANNPLLLVLPYEEGMPLQCTTS